MALHEELEKQLADLKRTEAALIFAYRGHRFGVDLHDKQGIAFEPRFAFRTPAS